MSIGHPIPEIRLFQILTLKIQGQGHGWGECWQSQSGCNILSIHIAFVPCQSALPFLRYSIFKIWPRKSKVKVMGEGNVESHKVGVTSYRFTSLSSMSIGPSIPEIQHFQNLTLKIQGQGHGWGGHWKSQSRCNILSTHIPFVHVNRPYHSWDTTFSKFDLENPRSRSWVRGTLTVTKWV